MFDHGSPAHETGHLLYTRHHSSVCKKLKELDGGHFYKNYLLEVNFTDIAGSMVRFDSQGDGLGRYNIYNYQRSEANSSSFGYKVVGKWFDEELSLDTSALLWNERTRVPPASVCSYPCSVGEVKITQVGDVCCWICNPCKDQEYVVGQFTCKKCPDGWWPTGDKADCYELPEQYMQWDSVFAIVPMVIAIVGILLTTFVIRTFMVHMETPIVKASGRELSFILLAGILVSFLMTFALLAKPSLLVCSFQRFGVGFGFSIMYGALLTKTNRISRIFDSARRSARRPSFISPKSQVIICAIFVGIQVLTTIVWFILEPPGVRHWFPDLNRKSEVVLKCKVKDPNFLFSLIYNMLLITTCTVYAGMTRKIPENFNESKFIGFTMYTTCIIWLSFVPLFFTTGNSFQIQITTLCVSISLSAYVALFCLFSPKIYIILFHPDKNVRKLTMNSATYKKAPTSSSAFPTNTGSNHGPPDGLPEERAKLLEPALTRSASGSTGSGISQVKSGPVGGGPPLAPVGRKRGSLVKRASEGKTEVEIVQETTPGDLSSQCDNKAHDEPTAAPVGMDIIQPTCPATSGPLLSPLSASHTKSMPSPSAVINAMELETLATL
ncbi:Metabotropic glutamate receptor [Halotydeus destructor]|nr:Metabotropic glutamate receptor [Halotydeus destructor]